MNERDMLKARRASDREGQMHLRSRGGRHGLPPKAYKRPKNKKWSQDD